MKHIIVGTAGHVDHGKTALIRAMNGFDGDNTKEERKRGITIDLSFSNIQNDDTNIAFIDVPGHEKLIKNMVAGAFGFDASLVVVDALEGIMPQTTEHLWILDLLRVPNIIIAITKADLADDDTIATRKAQLEQYISEFEHLNLFDILPTSIRDPQSIEELKNALFRLPQIEHRDDGLFRYYIDRSFTIAGAGTVVTGTVLDGSVKVGDKLIVAELGKEVQVRNIQVHEQDVEIATTSQRTALNLQSNKLDLSRGYLLTRKGYMRGFHTIDVWIEAIAKHEIRHNSIVQFFVGTKQLEARVLLYNNQESTRAGLARIRFEQKNFMVFDEPFVIGISGRIIAGGRVLNPIDDPIKKRLKLPLLEALKTKDFKRAFEILVSTHKRGFGLISSNQRFGLRHDEALDIALELENVFVDENDLVIYPVGIMEELREKIEAIYTKNQYALLSANSIAERTKWASPALVETILEEMVKSGKLSFQNGIYKSAQIVVDDIETLATNAIYDRLVKGDIAPDAPYNIYDDLDLDRKMGDKALKKLTKSRKVVRLAHNLFVTSEALSKITAIMKQIIRNEGYIEISNFKTHFPDLSRKYLISYLEYLDRQSGIIRDGNRRIMP